MRLAMLVLIGLVLAMAIPAQATFCPDCRKGGPHTKDIGVCSNCKDRCTQSGQFKLCMRCSSELKQCEQCAKPLAPATTQPTTRPISPILDAAYTEGDWAYRFTVTLRGSRSEGSTGELLYKGKPVAEPEAANDFYQTPWGPMYWMGKRPVLHGPHGWMTKVWFGTKIGKQLPDPAKTQAAAPRLMLRIVVLDRQPVPNVPKLEGWILDELKKLSVQNGVAGSDWEPLTDQFNVIHDSRHYGQLQVRLGTSKDPQALVADFGGAESQVVLPRQAGATRLVHVPLQSSIARMDLYLAFKVEDK